MPYFIPSIHDINAHAGSNGLTVISTFAGAGGSSIGYKMAGFNVKVACEFIPAAIETYRANAPQTIIVEDDIREVTGERLMKLAGVKKGELDVLDGSPPCSGFSMSGAREKRWGEEHQYSGQTSQVVDDLFFEFSRLIDEIHPKVFVAENVFGLASGTAKGYFKEIFNALENAGPGYVVKVASVLASQLGVPQKRKRLIFIGVRCDIDKEATYPLPVGYTVPVGFAIEGVDPNPPKNDYEDLKLGSKQRVAYDNTDLMRDKGCFKGAYGRLWNKPNTKFNWFKIDPSKPCPTLTAKVSTLFRWDEARTLTPKEAKRVQTFPDDFVLPGTSFRKRWERIGRAVPPLMMGHIARQIAKDIFNISAPSLVEEMTERNRPK